MADNAPVTSLVHGRLPQQPEPETRRRSCSLLQALLPFLKLREVGGDMRWQCLHGGHPKLGEAFLLSALVWLLMAFLVGYLMLVISSTTFQFVVVKDHLQTVQKAPYVGKHYQLFLIFRSIMQVLVLHHICGNLMEPLSEIRAQHVADCELMHPIGVVQHLLKVWCFVRRRQWSPRWLSTYIADHLLLLVVGSMAVLSEANLLFTIPTGVNKELVDSVFLFGVQQSWLLALVASILTIYCSVLVMGFLLVTLEETVPPKPQRIREYTLAMSLFLLLWATNFLTVLFERQVFTSAWTDVFPGTRMLAAAEMVFVTHSSVMLGAVLFGHSSHFKRCPDMTWEVFGTRVVPLLLLSAFSWGLMLLRTTVHSNESCFPATFAVFAKSWPYLWTIWTAGGGSLLLFLALRDEGQEAHGGASSSEILDSEPLCKILDYDTMLVLLTFGGAVFWNVAKVFDMEAGGHPWDMLSYLLALLAPLGLSAFSLVVWKRPPKLNTGRAHGLWFALFFTAVMFADFQEKEDCEISSDLPSCCSYPWITAQGKELLCNRALRCHLHPDCSVPDDEPHLKLGGPEHNTPHFSEEECDILAARWEHFMHNVTKQGYLQAMQDAVHTVEHESTAYRLFVIFGQAASVEVYFTIFGVLLKVMFLTHHPKSEEILSLDSYHNHLDMMSGGNHVVVVPGIASSRGWGTVRAAARLGLFNGAASSREITGSEAPGDGEHWVPLGEGQ